MATTLTPRATIVNLNNIPLATSSGYGQWPCGKVHMKNGEFLLYANIGLKDYVNTPTEYVSAANVLFNEVPCDEDGNILLKSHWIQRHKNPIWPSPEVLVCFFLFSAEPTHRVDLQTGAIKKNTLDEDYIRNVQVQFGAGVY